MAGRKPDFDVLVAVKYVDSGGVEKTRFHNVRAGWSDENGTVRFTVVTQPGVTFVVCKKRDEKKKAA
jgi:intracellular sulfur oxidation DsrE/DsrF family protein